MFLKTIHKSEESNLYCYQKRSYTESIGRSFNTFNTFSICTKTFSMSEIKYIGRFRLSKAQQSKILNNINVTVGN